MLVFFQNNTFRTHILPLLNPGHQNFQKVKEKEKKSNDQEREAHSTSRKWIHDNKKIDQMTQTISHIVLFFIWFSIMHAKKETVRIIMLKWFSRVACNQRSAKKTILMLWFKSKSLINLTCMSIFFHIAVLIQPSQGCDSHHLQSWTDKMQPWSHCKNHPILASHLLNIQALSAQYSKMKKANLSIANEYLSRTYVSQSNCWFSDSTSLRMGHSWTGTHDWL